MKQVVALVTLIIVACSDPESPDGPALDIVAGANVSDTISTRPTQGLVVRVSDENGGAAAGVEVRFETGGVLGMAVGTVGGQGFSSVVGAVTDANGRATVRVQFGFQTGAGRVAVAVPLFNLADTARYTILPGNPVSVRLSPADTVIVLGSSFTYRGTQVDREGNPIKTAGMFGDNGSVVEIDSSGLVTSSGVGRAIVIVTTTFNGPAQAYGS